VTTTWRRQADATAAAQATLIKARKGWTTLIPGAHPGYISWGQFETNQATLTAIAAARGEDRKTGPAREGANTPSPPTATPCDCCSAKPPSKPRSRRRH